MSIAAVAGLAVSGLYRDTAEGIRQARATDLVHRKQHFGPVSSRFECGTPSHNRLKPATVWARGLDSHLGGIP